METAVIAMGRNTVHIGHLVESPRCKDEQTTVGTSVETLALGFPIGRDGFFLYMNERITLL